MGSQATEQLPLTGATLAQLDRGRAGEAIDKALGAAVRDCFDRPADDRPRKITVTIEVKPIAETHENTVSCEGASAVYKVRMRQPDYESAKLSFGIRKGGKHGGMLIFSPDSPGNVNQGLLPLHDEEDAE